jgi:hypothetical protein
MNTSGRSSVTSTVLIKASDLYGFPNTTAGQPVIMTQEPGQQGFTGSIQVNTSTNTVYFALNTWVHFNVDVITKSTTRTTDLQFTLGSDAYFLASDITQAGITGSISYGGAGDSRSGGGGGGLFGGGGGVSGGAGGNGSGLVSPPYTLIQSSGSQSPFSKYNTSTTQYGWAGINPTPPQIILETYSQRTTPAPALIVNGSELVTGAIDVVGTSQLRGNTNVGVSGGFNAWLTVGNAPVSVPTGGDIVASNNIYAKNITPNGVIIGNKYIAGSTASTVPNGAVLQAGSSSSGVIYTSWNTTNMVTIQIKSTAVTTSSIVLITCQSNYGVNGSAAPGVITFASGVTNGSFNLNLAGFSVTAGNISGLGAGIFGWLVV